MAVGMTTRLDRVLGAKTAKAMAEQLALYTVRDLLRHYPRRYHKRGEMTRLDDLQVGDRVTVVAQVRSVDTRPMRQRRGNLTEVTVGDGAGSMQLVFFNRRHANLREGAWGLFAGTVGEYRSRLQFAHPDCHLMTGDDDEDWARALIPIYPASKDVSSWVIQRSVKLLLDASGGFGTVVGFVHDWANPENTMRSWDMVARYVVPEINGYLASLRQSADFVANNRAVFDRSRDAVMAKINENEAAAAALAVTESQMLGASYSNVPDLAALRASKAGRA